MESSLPAGPGPGAGESRGLGRPGTPAGSSEQRGAPGTVLGERCRWGSGREPGERSALRRRRRRLGVVPLKQPRNLGTASEISALQRQFPRGTAPAAAPACKPGCMEMPLCTETCRRVGGKG